MTEKQARWGLRAKHHLHPRIPYSALALSLLAAGTLGPARAESTCESLFADQAKRGELLREHPLGKYEAFRAMDKTAEKSIDLFRPKQGIRVTRRDRHGRALEGLIRVLVDNPEKMEIYLIGPFNQWGKALNQRDRLRPIPNTPYYEGTVRELRHGMQYRLLVNGRQVLDPASSITSTPELMEKLTGKASQGLNSVFWDHRASGYQRRYPTVNLRGKYLVGMDVDFEGLVANWKYAGKTGPDSLAETYRFIAESGVIKWLKNVGQINVVRFPPFNPAVDGDMWFFNYLAISQRGINTKYGTPEDLKLMIDAFHKEGIAVQLDVVAAHGADRGNLGERSLDPIGSHQFRKLNGSSLYFRDSTQWGGSRYYDFENPFVRRYLVDSVLDNIKEYGFDAVRVDHVDGILKKAGGVQFLRELIAEVRKFRPEITFEGEIFSQFHDLEVAQELGGIGFDFRTHGDFILFKRDNLVAAAGQIDMARLRAALHQPFERSEPFQTIAVTNRDEASLNENVDGVRGVGANLHALVEGMGESAAERYVQTLTGIAALSGSHHLLMPEALLKQKGSWRETSRVDWNLAGRQDVAHNAKFFTDLLKYSRNEAALAPQNMTSATENHVDHDHKVISFHRYDPATGKHVYAIANMGAHLIGNYGFGVEHSGQFRLVLDNHDKRYGGEGKLRASINGSLGAEAVSAHGKPAQLTLPVLLPYSFAILESLPKSQESRPSLELVVPNTSFHWRFQPSGVTIRQFVGKTSELPERLRAIFKDLQKRTNAEDSPDGDDVREMGAFIFESRDGKFQTFKYTSDLFNEIQTKDMLAWARNGVSFKHFDSAADLKKVYFVHTHPDIDLARKKLGYWGFPGLGEDDVKVSIKVQAKLRKEFGRDDLPFEAIVLPRCKECDGVYFSFEPPSSLAELLPR